MLAPIPDAPVQIRMLEPSNPQSLPPSSVPAETQTQTQSESGSQAAVPAAAAVVPSRGDEFVEYRKRVLDATSKSFCAAKWLNATIWLDQGATTSCHHPPYHNISLLKAMTNPSAIHNTDHKKEMRRQMLKGIRPKECDYCWKIEDLGPQMVSDRVFKSIIYSKEDIERISKADFRDNTDLRTLEISFGRACQFACAYCNDSFSTTWSKDLQAHGPYAGFKSQDGLTYVRQGTREHVTANMTDSERYLYKGLQFIKNKWHGREVEYNPFVDAFWKWWPKLSKSLTELRVTGGEPLMSPDFWKLVERFRQEKPKIRLAVNSNLGARPELIDRLAAVVREIPGMEVYTSCEAFGPQAEYIRDGLNYQQWRKNIFKLRDAGLERLHVMMTVNALCLFSITDLFDDILSWRTAEDREIAIFTLNILRFPAFMNVLVLPQEVREERAAHLNNWLRQHGEDPRLHDFEVLEIRRLIDYLTKVSSSHEKALQRDDLWLDFITFHQQYDRRRKKSLTKTFPELIPYLPTTYHPST